MKYRVMAFAMFLLFSFTTQVSSTCIDLSKNQMFPMLHSIGPAHQVIKTGETTTITEPGSYQLVENIIGNIVVSTDNVVIDLNGFTIFAGKESFGVIIVSPGVKNVVIKNGTINADFSSSSSWGNEPGITVENGTQAIVIEDIKVINATQGIWFAGTVGNEIKCCKVINCFVSNCLDAFTLQYTNNSIFESCDNCSCGQAGFKLETCKYNKIKKCKSVSVGSDDADENAVGFWATGGTDNLFYECMAEGIYKEGSDFCTEATGFLFDGGETESKIVNCLVDSVDAGDTDAVAYGIHLNIELKDAIPECPFVQENVESDITDVSWSPAGDKVAIITKEDNPNQEPRIKIYQFDCCAWSQIITLTNQNMRHAEWDPTGRYLAMSGAGDDEGPEMKVYDIVYKQKYIVETARQTYNPVWSRDSKYVTYIVNNAGSGNDDRIDVYRVDPKGLTLVKQETLTGLRFVRAHAISPDEKFLAFGNDNDNDPAKLYVYNWSFLPPFMETEVIDSGFETSIGVIRDLAFAPIGCCGEYSLVVVGDKDNTTGNIQVINIKNGSPVAGTAIDFGADILRVKFSPNGKYFAVLGQNGTLGIYKADPISGNPTLVGSYSLGYAIGSGGIDWSPSGRYVTLGGKFESDVEAPDFAILEVATVPTKNVIVNNKIANVYGGICQIGIEGASCSNGIMKNIVYKACVPYSKSVLNVWYDGLVGIDQNHINLAVPPYGVVPFVDPQV